MNGCVVEWTDECELILDCVVRSVPQPGDPVPSVRAGLDILAASQLHGRHRELRERLAAIRSDPALEAAQRAQVLAMSDAAGGALLRLGVPAETAWNLGAAAAEVWASSVRLWVEGDGTVSLLEICRAQQSRLFSAEKFQPTPSIHPLANAEKSR